MKALVTTSFAAGALAFEIAAGQGCMLLVGDGDYKVGPRGLGEPCTSIAGCASNRCACEHPNCRGWCTTTCAMSSDCAGDYSGGATLLGQRNSCITNASVPPSNTCFPGCSTNADCAAFPGTVCEGAATIENSSVSICTLPSGDAGI